MTSVQTICKLACCVVLSLLVCSSGCPAADCCRTPWYGDHERGWFFYEPEPEPEPELLLPPVPEPQQAEATAGPAVPPGPAVLSVEWIKKYLEIFKTKAIDEPTPENVSAYLYIQRVMLDKSERFSEAVGNVVRKDPFLDQNSRRPLAAFANMQFARAALSAREELLAQVAKKVGIFFFFQSSCRMCEIQAPVLKNLQDRYGFVVFPVSVNGLPLGNGMFANYTQDRGQVRALGIVKTPALFLGRPAGREIIPLGQSALSKEQLEQNILAAAQEAGWITPEEFRKTQGMDTSLALNLKPEDMPASINEAEIQEYIKGLYLKLGEKKNGQN